MAVQPVYMHPYTAASMVSSLAYLHGRAVHLNMLAGGFRNDLIALGDQTEHDDRYARTVEYTQILLGLLRGETVTHRGPVAPGAQPAPRAGAAARADAGGADLRVVPGRGRGRGRDRGGADPLPRAARPGRPGRRAGRGRAGGHHRPRGRRRGLAGGRGALPRRPGRPGRARDGHADQRLALAPPAGPGRRCRRPHDPAGSGDGEPDPYWLGPFKNYQTFCPYLVGSYDRVGAAVAHYVDQGTRVFVLDIPPSAEELEHTGTVLARVGART